MNRKILLILVSLSFNILAMDKVKTIALAGVAQFSPSGRFVLVKEDQNVSLYETVTGKKMGSLENIKSKECSSKYPFRFSPRETYIAYRNQMWTRTDLKEHVSSNFRPANVDTIWNKLETVFVTANLDNTTCHLSDACTGQPMQTFTRPTRDFYSCLSDDGSLIAFAYCIAYRRNTNDPRTVLEVKYIKDNLTTLDIFNGQTLTFFPDNTHALITAHGSDVILVNALTGQKLKTFVCGNSSELLGNNADTTPCTIRIRNMLSIVTHPSAKDYFCSIDCKPDGTYSFKKYDKSIIKKKSTYQPMATDLAPLDHTKHVLSPDGASLILTTSKDKHTLCLLPYAHEMLVKDKQTHFSLLPADLLVYLRNFTHQKMFI